MHLNRLLNAILENDVQKGRVIVVDGGSKDATCRIADNFGVSILTSAPSRAQQLNIGAKAANSEWLYFVHADTVPPQGWLEDLRYLESNNLEGGTYRSHYENGPFLICLNAFFTRFNWMVSRGGDQSLFIKKTTFDSLGGFPDKMVVMEEYPLIEKLYKRGKFKLFSKCMKISARKYEGRSWWKVSRANLIAFRMYKRGVDNMEIKKRYDEAMG